MSSLYTDTIRTIRIDTQIRDGGGILYFFVRPEHEQWDAWWGELFKRLAGFGPGEAWKRDDENREIRRAELKGESRAELLSLLKTAPEAQRGSHRTLRETVRRLEEADHPAMIVFFMA